jgi:hypothetical protein
MSTTIEKLSALQDQLTSLVQEVKDGGTGGFVATSSTEIMNRLKAMEERMLARINTSEVFLVNQMEEQSLAVGIMTAIVVMSALYVFYVMIEQLTRIRRCRCPTDGWETVVKVARNQEMKMHQETYGQNPPTVATERS